MFSEALKNSLSSSLKIELNQVMEYATLPAGKLFRPNLCLNLAHDLTIKDHQNIMHLACAIELHHAYTLVHDDLPAMDNDLMRRGKPSTHAAFGEWQAILAGDALLVHSFTELTKINHSNFKKIFKIMTWATGSKGLIAGQYLDLSSTSKNNIQNILRIHELKTARLIQVATLGTYLLSTEESTLSQIKTYLRLGKLIGLGFQLLDDLDDASDSSISNHETEINPFLIAPSVALKSLESTSLELKRIIRLENLKHVSEMLSKHFQVTQNNLRNKDFSSLDKNIQIEIKKFISNFV